MLVRVWFSTEAKFRRSGATIFHRVLRHTLSLRDPRSFAPAEKSVKSKKNFIFPSSRSSLAFFGWENWDFSESSKISVLAAERPSALDSCQMPLRPQHRRPNRCSPPAVLGEPSEIAAERSPTDPGRSFREENAAGARRTRWHIYHRRVFIWNVNAWMIRVTGQRLDLSRVENLRKRNIDVTHFWFSSILTNHVSILHSVLI